MKKEIAIYGSCTVLKYLKWWNQRFLIFFSNESEVACGVKKTRLKASLNPWPRVIFQDYSNNFFTKVFQVLTFGMDFSLFYQPMFSNFTMAIIKRFEQLRSNSILYNHKDYDFSRSNFTMAILKRFKQLGDISKTFWTFGEHSENNRKTNLGEKSVLMTTSD